MLSIYDELFLLALDEEKGNFLPFTKKTIYFGLSGAILAELAVRGKICVNEKQRLEVVDASPTGDEILDEAIHEIGASDKPRKTSYWVSLFSERPKKLRQKLGEHLASGNYVHQDENHFFWSQNAQPDGQLPPSKFQMKKPLRDAIATDGDPDPNHLALLSLTGACNLLNLVFTQDELSIAERAIHEKVMYNALKNPNLQMIEEITEAVRTSIEDSND